MIHNCLWIEITSHSIYKNSSDLKSVTIVMIVFEQLQFRVSIYALCDYFTTHFAFQSNCQQHQWLAMRKPCGINRRRKNSPLTRSAPFTLPFFDVFSSHACHMRQLSAKKSTLLRSLSRREASHTTKIPFGHSLIFALLSLWLIRSAVRSSLEIQWII